MICLPIFWASIAISMNSSSLKPLQMIGVSLSASASTASSSGLEPASRPKLIRPAEVEHLFDDVPLLVDLDRVDAAVVALVVVLGDGRLEGLVDLAEAMLEDVGEAEQDRQVDAAQVPGSTSSFRSIERAGSFVGVDADVPVVVDREVALAPAGDVVQVAGVLRGPAFRGLDYDQTLRPFLSNALLLDVLGTKPSVSFEMPEGARKN